MVDQFMYIPNINTQMKRLNIKLNEPTKKIIIKLWGLVNVILF